MRDDLIYILFMLVLMLSALTVGFTVQWCYLTLRRKVRRWRVKRIVDEWQSEVGGWR